MRGRREVFAWCLYDWANSAFVLTVVSGFFPFFFKSYYSGAAVGVVDTTARLGLGNTVAGVAIALLSLVLGAVSDAGIGKKRFLGVFVALGAASTALLFFVGYGSWFTALTFFIVANIGFSCSNLFYDALLLDVSDKKSIDFVSSLGFAFGYLGGVLLFAFNVWMVHSPATFGFRADSDAVKHSFLLVAVWWILFSIPLFLFVKEKRRETPERKTFFKAAADAFSTIKKTFFAIVKKPELVLFLCAFWLYYDGINTFIRMAVNFGTSIGFGYGSLMTALIIVQIIAFPSSLLFGHLSSKVGAGRMISIGVLIYVFITGLGSIFMRTEAHFIALAAISGLAQGGIQALSRSYFGKMIPARESSEYFGFYNVVSRLAVVGPAVIGLIAMAASGMGAPDATASRIGMSSVSLFFAAGLAMLMFAERHRKGNEQRAMGNGQAS
ncbi:MAG: MFS transporter [Chitinispirillales bacterium]|jgi:UMF1 family MFS transporter|nr:MFS transporter [Chitinispirillales bacterium]